MDTPNAAPAAILDNYDATPLARYGGERPPAPDWFQAAIARPYETGETVHDGCKITYQAWGDPAHPPVFLVHGNGAHAHWWDFTAPFLADEGFYIVATNLSGMGDSAHRDSYGVDVFDAELEAVMEAAGLFDHAQAPIVIGHSFGGRVVMALGSRISDRLGGVVIVDSPVPPKSEIGAFTPRASAPQRFYESVPDILARFRLLPPQPCENDYVMDYIARWSVKRAEGDKWTWKFDPNMMASLDWRSNIYEHFSGISCRLAVMRGEKSALVNNHVWDYMHSLAGEEAVFISTPEAQHHVMLDQPLALTASLRTLLAAWKSAES